MFDQVKPIFIIGATNSGTKCLLYSLLQHRALGGLTRELHWYGFQPNHDGRINRLFALYPCFATNYADDTCRASAFGTGPLDPQDTRESIRHVLNTLHPPKIKPGSRLLIKDPKLSLRVKWLRKVWPDCHIIAITRNPWAVIEGIRRKLTVLGDVPLNLDIPTACAQYINTYTSVIVDSEGLDNFLWLRYEDMIQANKSTVHQPHPFWSGLLSKLQLSHEGFTIPNKSEYSSFRKGNDTASLSRLTRWETSFITTATADLCRRFGYSIGNDFCLSPSFQ